jgi:addiction module RelB/DinJ family antitoxin
LVEGALVRFRVDASVKDKVTEVCEKLGFDLADVLRAFMARVAEDGTLAFDMGAPSTTRTQRAPFAEYSERLWRDYRHVDAEVALALLSRFIADRATGIDAEASERRPDAERLAQLRQELAEARSLAQTLDPKDADAVAAVLATYGPRVASLT